MDKKGKWCNEVYEENWFKNASVESILVLQTLEKLKTEMESICYETMLERVMKTAKLPMVWEYMKYDIVEIQSYAYKISRYYYDSEKIQSTLSEAEKDLVREVFEERKEELQGFSENIRMFTKRFLTYLDDTIKENTRKYTALLGLKPLYEEYYKFLTEFLDQEYDLENQEDLLKILKMEKQSFYVTNILKRTSKEFEALSCICSKMNYQINVNLIEGYIRNYIND